MVVAVRERTKSEEVVTGPKFRDPTTMTKDELTDPDYRMKLLMQNFGGNKDGKPAICSKCHHCR